MSLITGTFTLSITIRSGPVSLKPSGGKLAPKLVYFLLEKELLNFGETAPWFLKRNILIRNQS